MSEAGNPAGDAAPQLTPLNGIRFFAVFHIFLYHLWSTRHETDFLRDQFADVYAGLDSLPAWANNLLAHGYLSTSFFFLLSGFRPMAGCPPPASVSGGSASRASTRCT